MSSSRESDASYESDTSYDSTSESIEEEAEFNPLEFIKLLIKLNRATVEMIVRFSVTSRANHRYILEWITTELHVLSDRNSSWMLLMFENVLCAGDEKAQWLAKLAVSNFSALGVKQSIENSVLERIVSAVRKSGYHDSRHELSVCNNAALYGNHTSLSCLLRYQFPVPRVVEKVRENFYFYFDKNNRIKAEAYLVTLRVITEHSVKLVLETVRDEIREFQFVLHNGGGVWCVELGRKIPARAAEVLNIINIALEKKVSLKSYADLRQSICDKLISVNEEESRGYVISTLVALSFFPTVARDSSTVKFYEELISMLDEAAADLNVYQRLARLFAGESLIINSTMPQ